MSSGDIINQLVEGKRSEDDPELQKMLWDIEKEGDKPDKDLAEEVYRRAVSEHPDFWEYEDDEKPSTPEERDVALQDRADQIFHEICAAYGVDPASDVADLIYEQVWAGLT